MFLAFMLWIIAPCSQLQKLAVDMQLMDQRETKIVFSNPDNIENDFAIIMNRYDFLHDAPPISDAMRYPRYVADLLEENRRYRTYLDNAKTLYPRDSLWFDDAIHETDDLWATWDLVRDVQCPYYFINMRRGQLKKLKIKLGDDAYYSGALPPHVPIWRFQRVP